MQRVLTALIMAPIAVGGLFFLPPHGFALFTGAIITIGAWEWARMSGWEGPVARIGYALVMALLMFLLRHVPAMPILWLSAAWWIIALVMIARYPAAVDAWRAVPIRSLMGVVVLIPAWVGLNHLRNGDFTLGTVHNNLVLILYTLCIVWAADIGAFFAGRRWGHRKLAPRVSPGKSWAGVYGGLASVGLLAVVVSLLTDCSGAQATGLLLVSLFVALVSVVGDLFESMLKRYCGLKDSSQLLPGHGGFMDRIDSLTAAIPVFSLCMTLLMRVTG